MSYAHNLNNLSCGPKANNSDTDIISFHRKIGITSNFYSAYYNNIIMVHYYSNNACYSSGILQVSLGNGLSHWFLKCPDCSIFLEHNFSRFSVFRTICPSKGNVLFRRREMGPGEQDGMQTSDQISSVYIIGLYFVLGTISVKAAGP